MIYTIIFLSSALGNDLTLVKLFLFHSRQGKGSVWATSEFYDWHSGAPLFPSGKLC